MTRLFGARWILPLGHSPLGLLLLLPALLWTSACASSGGLETPRLFGPSRAGEEPWILPASSYPSQRLFRVKYEGPEGKVGFKLTLYLASPSHYRMVASDSLGRKLWSLQVEESGEAIWLDHRGKKYCQVEGAERLVVVPLANLPLVALPRLLLGRMPADPAADLSQEPTHVSYLDMRGQQWHAVLDGTGLEWWSMRDLGETVAWWRRDGEDGGDFSDARGQQRVTWRQIVAEVVEQTLEPLVIPERFAEGSCGDSSTT